jgi:catecholate siderophore receptor
MSSHNKFARKRIAVLVTLAFVPAHAWAEDAVVTPQAQEVEALPEVNVKGRADAAVIDGYKVERASSPKFTAPLIDTPKTVTVITENVIKDTGALTFQDALRTSPGITFGAAEGGGAFGDRPFIRGFDTQSSTYVDGIRDVGSQTREIFAAESIEVLKGPSGAFDGRGSAGGSINIVSKLPKAESFNTAFISLGTDSFMRGTFDTNVAVNEDVAFRIVGMAHDADAPGRDVVESERHGIMPSITVGMNSPTSLTLSWYHLKTNDIPDWGTPFFNDGVSIVGRPISVDRDNFYGIKGRDFRDTRTDIGTMQFRHEFSEDVVLRNTTRIANVSNDYVMTRPTVSVANLAAGQVTRSTRGRDAETESFANVTDLTFAFHTGSIKHNMTAGLEFSHEKTDTVTYMVVDGPNADLYNPDPNDFSPDAVPNTFYTDARVINKAAFVFDSMELSKKWILNLGLRYDNYESTLETDNPAALDNRLGTDDDFMNYQAGIVYKLLPNASIYASYGTSSSPVGLGVGAGNQQQGNNLAVGTEDLDPERSRSFEVGTKWDVLNNLSLTAAVFRTRKTDARVPTAVAGEFVNAGELEVKGFEFGAAGKITSKWQVFGGYIYMDSEQKDGADIPGGPGDFGIAANDGKEMPTIAKNSATLWTTYDVLPNFRIGGGAFYSDRVWANPGNTAYLPSYVRWDAMAAYKINDNLSLQLNAQNLTDKKHYIASYTSHGALLGAGRFTFLSLNLDY